MITQEYLKSVLYYNQDTGNFVWIKKENSKSTRIKIGEIAGCIDNNGYRIIRISGKGYKSHRLAWLYIYGNLPFKMIDHINGNKIDNRISNLREVSNKENQLNQNRHRLGSLPGAIFRKKSNKWQSYINLNNKFKHLGYFNTELEAHEKYKMYNLDVKL
jgi:hypothetical protein